MKMCNIKTLSVLTCMLMLQRTAEAATATWSQTTAGQPWSVPSNWSGATPTGNDVIFSTAGRTASSTIIGNIVNQDITISSLTYRTYVDWQVTQIDSGVTLSLAGGTGNILAVGYSTDNLSSQAAITGAGKLLINQADANMIVATRSTNSAPSNNAILDLSGLAAFEATLDAVYVGAPLDNSLANTWKGTLKLANNNKITANSLFIGYRQGGSLSQSRYESGSVTMGVTNELFVDRIDVGGERGLGTLSFESGLEGASVVIRGKNSMPGSPTRAAMNVGYTIVTPTLETYGPVGGTANFAGGRIDALLSTLNIAYFHDNAEAGSVTGSFLMNAGTVDAQSVIIAQKNAGGPSTTGTVTGQLDVGGGTFTTQTLSMSKQVAGVVGTATSRLNIYGSGQVNVTGGGILMGDYGITNATISVQDSSRLAVTGDIAKGTHGTTNATLNLNGGTLEMNGHNLVLDTFNVESGTLRNLGQFNSGGTLVKTTAGTVSIEGANTWTGNTVVAAGTLLINGTHVGGSTYTVSAGATLGGTGVIATAGNSSVILAAGGKLSPGNSPGTLTFNLGTGSLDISAGVSAIASQALIFELGSSSDLITLSGTLNIGLGLLDFDDFVFLGIAGFGPGEYVLFNTNSAIIGSLGASLSGSINGFDATLGLSNGNQSVVLSVVPEPSSFATMLFSLFSGVLFLRRGRIFQ